MPWKNTMPMTERLSFIGLHHAQLYSMAELCLRFGISRKTGYKWLARYAEEGFAGTQERSRAPHHSPLRILPEIEALLLDTRGKYPSWGPRKLRAYLVRRHPALSLPSPSTIRRILSRHGLTQAKQRRRRVRHPGAPRLQVTAPNEVWTADFKGQFRTGDGLYCFPLTLADAYSRYLLGCVARLSTKQTEARPVFERLFQEYGLPGAIRTDNGAPFVTPALCGLSKLSVWWIKLGIAHHRIEPGRPEQNGAHERMHRTLKAEATRPPERNQEQQQQKFDAFCRTYNEERPHEALGQATPSLRYKSSERPMPQVIPEPEYPGHFLPRKVSNSGTFRFKHRQLFLSDTLLQETVGMEETDDGIWAIHFYDVLLARLDERDFKLRG